MSILEDWLEEICKYETDIDAALEALFMHRADECLEWIAKKRPNLRPLLAEAHAIAAQACLSSKGLEQAEIESMIADFRDPDKWQAKP